MTSHEEIRLTRLAVIEHELKKKNVDIEKLISKKCMTWGCSRRAMLEYIKVVKNS